MADRILGLAGPGQGPWVCTANMTRPLARVIGLKTGVLKVFGSVLGKDSDKEEILELVSSSIFPLPYFPFMRAEYRGPDRTMVLTIHQGRTNAINPD